MDLKRLINLLPLLAGVLCNPLNAFECVCLPSCTEFESQSSLCSCGECCQTGSECCGTSDHSAGKETANGCKHCECCVLPTQQPTTNWSWETKVPPEITLVVPGVSVATRESPPSSNQAIQLPGSHCRRLAWLCVWRN